MCPFSQQICIEYHLCVKYRLRRYQNSTGNKADIVTVPPKKLTVQRGPTTLDGTDMTAREREVRGYDIIIKQRFSIK